MCGASDGESEDADFPAQFPNRAQENCSNAVEWPHDGQCPDDLNRFRGRWCYALPPGAPVVTVRDGEVADGDKSKAGKTG